MAKLTYGFDGRDYIKIRYDIAVNRQGHADVKKLSKKIKEYDGVEIYLKYKYSFFGLSKITIKFLIPANRVVEFSSTNLDDK